MAELKTYYVAAREVYRKMIAVRAISRQGAERRAWDGWLNGEIIFTEDNFHGADFYVMDEAPTPDGLGKPAGDFVIQGFGSDDKYTEFGKGTAKNGR